MERENRQYGNQEKGKARKEGREEKEEVTFLQTEHNGDAQASPNFFWNEFSLHGCIPLPALASIN